MKTFVRVADWWDAQVQMAFADGGLTLRLALIVLLVTLEATFAMAYIDGQWVQPTRAEGEWWAWIRNLGDIDPIAWGPLVTACCRADAPSAAVVAARDAAFVVYGLASALAAIAAATRIGSARPLWPVAGIASCVTALPLALHAVVLASLPVYATAEKAHVEILHAITFGLLAALSCCLVAGTATSWLVRTVTRHTAHLAVVCLLFGLILTPVMDDMGAYWAAVFPTQRDYPPGFAEYLIPAQALPLVAVTIFWGLLAVGLAWALRARHGDGELAVVGVDTGGAAT